MKSTQIIIISIIAVILVHHQVETQQSEPRRYNTDINAPYHNIIDSLATARVFRRDYRFGVRRVNNTNYWIKLDWGYNFKICIINHLLPINMTVKQFEDIVLRVANEYGRYTGLDYTIGCSGAVDQYISFQRRFHNQNSNYPTRAARISQKCKQLGDRELAHAFYPPMYDIHINVNDEFTLQDKDEEIWTGLITKAGVRYLKYERKYSLYCVIKHEFGHSMGLEHNNSTDSFMYEGIQILKLDCPFHQSDIDLLSKIWKTFKHDE